MSGIHKILHLVVMGYNTEGEVPSGHDFEEIEVQNNRLRRWFGACSRPTRDRLNLGLAVERWYRG
jgi:hypothetical protein